MDGTVPRDRTSIVKNSSTLDSIVRGSRAKTLMSPEPRRENHSTNSNLERAQTRT